MAEDWNFFKYDEAAYKKQPTPIGLPGYTQFMSNRHFGSNQPYIFLVNELNKVDITDVMHFNFLWYAVPRRGGFMKYTMKVRKADKVTKLIMKHFQVNEERAEEYRLQLSKQDVKELKEMYPEKRMIRSKKHAD
jgi:hypothetical protein